MPLSSPPIPPIVNLHFFKLPFTGLISFPFSKTRFDTAT